jgi:hypothetical protein
MRKKYGKFFKNILKVTEGRCRIRIRIHWSEVRIRGSGSAPKCHGSPTQQKKKEQKCEFYLCNAIDEELTVGVEGKLGDPSPSRLPYSQGRSLGQQKSLYSSLPVI